METAGIEASQRKAARIAGLAFPISFVIVVLANFGILGRLTAPGNAAQTARNILANETLFRIGIVGDIVYCVGTVVLLTALDIILKPVDRHLALLAALCRLVHVVTWLLVAINLFAALRLLTDAGYSRAFGPDQMQNLVRLYLGGTDAYYVGLLFWALGAAVAGYVWFKSRYVPRALAAFGVISSAWCAGCTFVFYMFPDFTNLVNLWWFDSPMGIFEMALSIWLLFKGLSPAGMAEPNRASG